MTTARITKIGLVAHFSEHGDWAFETALRIARSGSATLNVFLFLESPYEVPQDLPAAQIPVQHHDEWDVVHSDRALRERWDEWLGDFVEVGYRVCEHGRHKLELCRCLKRREYQLLIIPYLARGISFGNMTIEEFAHRFVAPVLLVGPERPDQYFLNPPARMLLGPPNLLLEGWLSIPVPDRLQTLPVL